MVGIELNYYKVSYKNCEGNKKENADYDPEKPCSDCTKGNVVINPEIQPQTTACGVGGGMYGYTRGVYYKVTSGDLSGLLNIELEVVGFSIFEYTGTVTALEGTILGEGYLID